MDRGINASFIPKKDIRNKRGSRTPLAANLFLLIGFIIFLATLLASLAVFLYSKKLDGDNARALETLEKNRDNYGLSAIEEFIDLNNRIKAGERILANHVNVNPVFTLLENDTLTDVYLSNFTFETDGGEILISARGFAPTYAHVALQADQYSANKTIKNLILSGVNQAREGGIQFDLDFAIDRDALIISNS